MRADNIIAHAYEAPSSPVENLTHDGFDAAEGRTYANDFTDPNSPKDLKASGFNTVGDGEKLVFDIQGVSPDNVISAGYSQDARNYKSQDVVDALDFFGNPLGFKDTVYKAKDVTLSINSSELKSETYNRGAELQKLYVDYGYIDTRDLNLNIIDAFVTDYAEFRNGNRGGEAGGHYIDANYRWAVIVDNDYHRNIANIYNIPVTAQLYTALTGSFALSMGNVIAQETKAPVVHYNPYEVVNLPRTENSFYRLTYKDDKIQKTTVTPNFSDIDKSTYKPTKRQYIRFSIVDPDDGFIKVSEKKRKNNARIIAINDISRGGVLVTHDGTLKVGEEFVLSLNCNGIEASPTVEVVRIYDSNKAGLKFGDLDSATANKILYMNMYSAEKQDLHTSQK